MRQYTEECRVAVFDVDGVLVELDLLTGSRRPRPVGLKALLELLSKGFRVYIVTGRPESRRGETLRELEEAGVPVARLAGVLMDSWGAGELASKLRNLEAILDREGCIGEYHDDNPAVLDSVGRRASALVLHYPGGCEVLRGHSSSSACGGRLPLRAME